MSEGIIFIVKIVPTFRGGFKINRNQSAETERSNFPHQNLSQNVTVTVQLILVAMAHHGYRAPRGEFLEQAQRELLAVILDRRVAGVNRPTLEKLFPVFSAELTPPDFSALGVPQKFFARPEIGHPDVIPRYGHSSAPKSRGQNAQAILTWLDG